MTQKMHIPHVVIVEGKYDKNTLSQVLDAVIITTGGFSVFNSDEKKKLILRLAADRGIILLTDSDGGGIQIRKYLSGILPPEKLFHIYIPKIKGKEKRKKAPSKSGLLGVEGMERDVIEKLFAPFVGDEPVLNNRDENDGKMITKLDFFKDGFSGGENSGEKRDALAAHFSLPDGMSAKALIDALNIISTYAEYKNIVSELEF